MGVSADDGEFDTPVIGKRFVGNSVADVAETGGMVPGSPTIDAFARRRASGMPGYPGDGQAVPAMATADRGQRNQFARVTAVAAKFSGAPLSAWPGRRALGASSAAGNVGLVQMCLRYRGCAGEIQRGAGPGATSIIAVPSRPVRG